MFKSILKLKMEKCHWKKIKKMNESKKHLFWKFAKDERSTCEINPTVFCYSALAVRGSQSHLRENKWMKATCHFSKVSSNRTVEACKASHLIQCRSRCKRYHNKVIRPESDLFDPHVSTQQYMERFFLLWFNILYFIFFGRIIFW